MVNLLRELLCCQNDCCFYSSKITKNDVLTEMRSPDGSGILFLFPLKRKRYSAQREQLIKKPHKNEAFNLKYFAGFFQFLGVADQLQFVNNLVDIAIHDVS